MKQIIVKQFYISFQLSFYRTTLYTSTHTQTENNNLLTTNNFKKNNGGKISRVSGVKNNKE